MARTQGPIQVWHRTDTIPTDAQGGYAGGDSTAAAIALSQGSVDALAEQVADINVGVGTLTARDNGDGTGTIVWTENAGSNGGGGDGDGHGGTVSWGGVTGKPSTFPPSPHAHAMDDLSADGVPSDRNFLRGDGAWAVPGNGSSVSGGCLRFYSSGVEIHVNDTHVNNAITGFGDEEGQPFDEKGRLIIRHTAPGGAIITIAASADETLTERGITAGCSGGVGRTLVQLAQNGVPLDLREDADYAKVAGNYSNLWMLWVHHAPNGIAP